MKNGDVILGFLFMRNCLWIRCVVAVVWPFTYFFFSFCAEGQLSFLLWVIKVIRGRITISRFCFFCFFCYFIVFVGCGRGRSRKNATDNNPRPPFDVLLIGYTTQKRRVHFLFPCSLLREFSTVALWMAQECFIFFFFFLKVGSSCSGAYKAVGEASTVTSDARFALCFKNFGFHFCRFCLGSCPPSLPPLTFRSKRKKSLKHTHTRLVAIACWYPFCALSTKAFVWCLSWWMTGGRRPPSPPIAKGVTPTFLWSLRFLSHISFVWLYIEEARCLLGFRQKRHTIATYIFLKTPF